MVKGALADYQFNPLTSEALKLLTLYLFTLLEAVRFPLQKVSENPQGRRLLRESDCESR